MKDRPRALAVLIALFLIGIIIGVAGSYLWLRPSQELSRDFNGRRPPSPEGIPRSNFPRLHLSPELTPEQKEQWNDILQETRGELDTLRKEQWEKMTEFDEKMNNIWQEHDQKWRAVLNEEQKVIFDEWVEEKREYRKNSPRPKGPDRPKENRRKPPTDSKPDRKR